MRPAAWADASDVSRGIDAESCPTESLAGPTVGWSDGIPFAAYTRLQLQRRGLRKAAFRTDAAGVAGEVVAAAQAAAGPDPPPVAMPQPRRRDGGEENREPEWALIIVIACARFFARKSEADFIPVRPPKFCFPQAGLHAPNSNDGDTACDRGDVRHLPNGRICAEETSRYPSRENQKRHPKPCPFENAAGAGMRVHVDMLPISIRHSLPAERQIR